MKRKKSLFISISACVYERHVDINNRLESRWEFSVEMIVRHDCCASERFLHVYYANWRSPDFSRSYSYSNIRRDEVASHNGLSQCRARLLCIWLQDICFSSFKRWRHISNINNRRSGSTAWMSYEHCTHLPPYRSSSYLPAEKWTFEICGKCEWLEVVFLKEKDFFSCLSHLGLCDMILMCALWMEGF